MNDETNDINVCITGKLNFDNELILQNSENEELPGMSSTENAILSESKIKEIVDKAKTFIQEEKYDDFGVLVEKLNREGEFRRLMEEEEFQVVYLKYKMHLGHYQDIFHILENVENTNNPIFVELWDKAHYLHHFAQHGTTPTSTLRFRIRKRNPPPHSICPGGVRSSVRLPESSVYVLRWWYSAHSTDPYPSRKAKQALAQRAGISIVQVNNWFTNTRRKHKKVLQKLNRSVKSTRTVTDKPRQEKDGKKLKLLDKSEETWILETGRAGDCEIHHKTDGNLGKNSNLENKINWSDHLCTLDHPNTVQSGETARQSSFSETSFFDKNLPSSVYAVFKQLDSKTVGFNDDETSNQRVPFTELSDNGLSEKNTMFKDELNEKQNDHGSENSKFVYSTDETITMMAKEDIYGYRQIRPKLKSEEKHSETKIKDVTSVLKLRVKLRERQIEPKSNKGLTENSNGSPRKTAPDCLISLEKVCENVDDGIESPVYYACSVDYEQCLVDLDDENGVVEHGVNEGIENNMNFPDNTSSNIRTTNENCAKLNLESEGGEDQTRDWNEHAVSPSSFYRPARSTGAQTLRSIWPEAGVDFYTGNRYSVTNIRTGVPMHFGNFQQYPQRDQMGPSSTDVFDNHQYASTGNQCFRSPGADWGTTGSPQSSQDVMSRSFLETSNLEDYHCVMRNSGDYGTVVGEAIQGLLNLSSSQESD